MAAFMHMHMHVQMHMHVSLMSSKVTTFLQWLLVSSSARFLSIPIVMQK